MHSPKPKTTLYALHCVSWATTWQVIVPDQITIIIRLNTALINRQRLWLTPSPVTPFLIHITKVNRLPTRVHRLRCATLFGFISNTELPAVTAVAFVRVLAQHIVCHLFIGHRCWSTCSVRHSIIAGCLFISIRVYIV